MTSTGALRPLQTSPNGTVVGKCRTPSNDFLKAKSLTPTTNKLIRDCYEDYPKRCSIGLKRSTGTDDRERAPRLVDIGVNTTLSTATIDAWTPNNDTIVAMMTASAPDDNYWRLYAEKRRKAYEEAQLELITCYKEIMDLKEENQRLRDLALENQEYADMVRQAMAEEQAAELTPSTDEPTDGSS